MELFYITNDPDEAGEADRAGIDRIFIDTEVLGKAERQKGLDTHLGSHTLGDVRLVKNVLSHAEVMVRVNPLNHNTAYEVEKAISCGADWIMLPMFTGPEEVAKAAEIINGRAKLVGLAETAASIVRMREIIRVKGINEIHIGLNDLTISLGLDFLFEPLGYGIVDFGAEMLNKAKMKWGFGGIARIGGGAIPCEMILMEHRRLGSTRVILSRAFRPQPNEEGFCLSTEVSRVRKKIAEINNMTPEAIEENRQCIEGKITEIAAQVRQQRK